MKTATTHASTAHNHALDSAIRLIDEFFDGVFGRLEQWRPSLTRILDGALRHGEITSAELAPLIEPGAHAILGDPTRPLYGAGFCASENVVAAGNPLAWWQGPDRSPLTSSTFGPTQTAIDMDRFEWYRVPHSNGRQHVAGPFVDYLCSHEITVTMSVPLEIHGQFGGVMGADILVATLEELLMPQLAALPGAVVLNSSGRVAISTHADYETGDRVALSDADAGACPGGRALAARSGRHPFAVLIP